MLLKLDSFSPLSNSSLFCSTSIARVGKHGYFVGKTHIYSVTFGSLLTCWSNYLTYEEISTTSMDWFSPDITCSVHLIVINKSNNCLHSSFHLFTKDTKKYHFLCVLGCMVKPMPDLEYTLQASCFSMKVAEFPKLMINMVDYIYNQYINCV